jgi:PAS domain-containing protein
MEHLFPKDSVLPAVFDAIPSLLLLTDGDVKILEANRAARRVLGGEIEQQPPRRGGDVLECIFARDAHDGCGTSEFCPACVLRKSVETVIAGRPAPRRIAHMILGAGSRSEDHWFQVSASPLTLDGQQLVLLVLDDATELVELREMVPFCPGCGEVRDVAEMQSQAEIFRRRHPDFLLAQELCSDCERKPPPDLEPEE